MEITLQYFDDCPNWEILDGRLAELLDGRSDIRVTRQLVETAEYAERLGFHGSPTVLVDGVDPFSDEHAPSGSPAGCSVPLPGWRGLRLSSSCAKRFPSRAWTAEARSGVGGAERRVIGPFAAGETRP